MSYQPNDFSVIRVQDFNARNVRAIYAEHREWTIAGFLQVCEDPGMWGSSALREIGSKLIAVPMAIAMMEMRDMLLRCADEIR